MFTRDEIEAHLPGLGQAQNEEVTDYPLDGDNIFPEDASAAAERAQHFNLNKELMRAGILGTA